MTEAGAEAGKPSGSHRGIITICVMLATLMQTLDTTIANVALPYMQGTLSATYDQINWVLTSYIVAAAIMTPPTGWLAERFGRKRLFLVAVAGFTVASMLCGAATSLPEMVAFRVLQGIFGAPLVPLSQAVMLDSYPREQQGSAMAMWGVGVMVGPILGPTLGGYLTDAYSWRWVFYINLFIGVGTFLGLSTFLAETRKDKSQGLDWFGFATLSVALGALQMMLDRGERLDWFTSPEIIIEAVLCGLAFYLFVVQMATAKQPFITPRIFKDRNFVAGLVFIFILGIVLLATMALLTPFLQTLMGYPVLTAGLVLSPRGLGTMLAMLIAGRLTRQIDPRLLITLGLLLTAVSLWEMVGFTPDVSEWAIIRSGFVQGMGLGFCFVALTTITFATLVPELRTQGTALFSLMRNLGSSIGISVVIFLLNRNTDVMHAALVEHVTPFSALARDPGMAPPWNLTTQQGLAGLDGEIVRQASAIAYVNDFKLMMIVTLAALLLVPVLRKQGQQPGSSPVVVD
jgi:DHA2 family multidrug resistance protein